MKLLEGIVVAFNFLTRFWLPFNIEWDSENIKYSLLFFPLVGAAIGGILLGVGHLVSLTKLDPALVILFAWVLITGGLHIDGLSDTVDGLSARKDRETSLKIMDDSHIGAFGVMAIFFLLFFKYQALTNLVEKNPYPILFIPVFARLVAGFCLTFFKTAKTSGLAYFFHSSSKKWPILISIMISIGFLYNFNPRLLLRVFYAIMLMVPIIFPIYKKLDGFTGDVYGMIVELYEVILLSLCMI